MKYEKPTITFEEHAIRVIQKVNKPNIQSDNCESPTANAYEADE